MPILSKSKDRIITTNELFSEYSYPIIYKYAKYEIEKRSIAEAKINIQCDNCGAESTKTNRNLQKRLKEYEGKIYCKRCLAGFTNLKLYGDWNYCNKEKILNTKSQKKTIIKEDSLEKDIIEKYKVVIQNITKPILLKDIAKDIGCSVKYLIPKLTKYNLSHDDFINNKFPTFCKVCNEVKSFKSEYCSRACQCIDKNKGSIFLERLSNITHTIIPLEDYTSTTTKILCRCLICENEWRVAPDTLLRGVGCPECANKKRGELLKYPYNKFIKEVHTNSPNFVLVDKEYDTHTPSLIRCRECGKIREAPKSLLREGKIICLYCKSKMKSIPESLIERFFIQNSIKYIYQKKFNSLKGRRNPLRFDFYLPDYNLCVEYDGQGHFHADFYLNKTGILDYTNDKKKDDYCNLKGIKLLRVPYWEQRNMIEYIDFYLNELKDFNSVITNNYRGIEYSHLIKEEGCYNE